MQLDRGTLGELIYIGHYRSIPSARIQDYCESQWYLLVLGELVRRKILRQAECWFLCDREFSFSQYDVTVKCFRDLAQMKKCRSSVDLLWVRGIHRNYLPILNRLSCRLRVFYAASKRLVPLDWPYYDLVLVDDDRHILPASRLVPRLTVKRVLKTTDPAIFKPLSNTGKQYDLIVIGDMRTERKNFAALVEILGEEPALTTVIVGTPEKELMERLKGTGAPITFIDYCTRKELNLLFNLSRITFLPNLFDAAPRVILESMAAGTPIVAQTGLFGGRDYIDPLVGIVAPPDKMLQAIRTLLQGKHRVNPKQVFDQRFTPAKAADHLGELLREAMIDKGRTTPEPPPNRLQRLGNIPFFKKRKLETYWKKLTSEAGGKQ